MQAIHRCLLVLLALLTASSARAEVVALKILKREPFAGGKVFGEVGPYEQITALARFAIDPKDERNRIIVDLEPRLPQVSIRVSRSARSSPGRAKRLASRRFPASVFRW